MSDCTHLHAYDAISILHAAAHGPDIRKALEVVLEQLDMSRKSERNLLAALQERWNDVDDITLIRLSATLKDPAIEALNKDKNAAASRAIQLASVNEKLKEALGDYQDNLNRLVAYFKPNTSNDMPWSDEIIITHENEVQALKEQLDKFSDDHPIGTFVRYNGVWLKTNNIAVGDPNEISNLMDSYNRDIEKLKAEIDAAWKAFRQGRAGRGLTTLADMINIDRDEIAELKAEKAEVERVCERYRAIAADISLKGAAKTVAELAEQCDAALARAEAAEVRLAMQSHDYKTARAAHAEAMELLGRVPAILDQLEERLPMDKAEDESLLTASLLLGEHSSRHLAKYGKDASE